MRFASLLFVSMLLAGLPSAGAEHVPSDAVDWACGGFGGGRPGDCGIKAVHDPTYTRRAWMPADDRVIGVEIAGEAKAFPTRMLDNHEIVTDTIGGVNVAVTWCPLCGSALVFDRIVTIEGKARLVQFDVSGYLYRHDLVMWEPETRTLWTQIEGRPIATWTDGGMSMDHPDAELRVLPSELTTWSAWQKAHPNSLLLSNEGEPYGGAYAGYEDSCRFGVSSQSECDIGSLHPKEFVVGVELDSESVAYPIFGVRTAGEVVVDERDDTTLVVVAERNGAARVFDAGDHRFHREEGVWFDAGGEQWDLNQGRSASGFQVLERVESVTLFWFAWKEHHEDTRLWLPEDTSEKKPLDSGGIPGVAPPLLVGAVLLVLAVLRQGRRRARD